MIAHVRQLGRILFDGLRAVLLLRPRPEAFAAGLPVIVMVCLLALLALAGFEYATAVPPRRFNATGLSSAIAGQVVLLVLLCLLPVRWFGLDRLRLFLGSIATGLLMLLVATPIALLARPLVSSALEDTEAASAMITFAAFFGLLALGILVTFRLAFGLAERRRWLAACAATLIGVVSAFLLPTREIIAGAESNPIEFSLLQMAADALRPARTETETTEPAAPRVDFEATLMRQPALMAEAARPLLPARDDKPELYFLGFAPYGGQDVFKRELTSVKDMFDTRFGTEGRSLVLSNHRDTYETVPLAIISNLETALAEIGRRMRPERDVLVFFVTSHGAKNHISVDFFGGMLKDLTPQRLLKALDMAGIKNRVLVLSACHSGSFVEALSNDDTLILTAAHAEKTSFGCSNEREWTYFGDAYFNHALREERSFVTAFTRASELIAKWEKEQGLTPSEPQMSVGSAIRARIDALLAARLAEAR